MKPGPLFLGFLGQNWQAQPTSTHRAERKKNRDRGSSLVYLADNLAGEAEREGRGGLGVIDGRVMEEREA